jgi:hypothetical protein
VEGQQGQPSGFSKIQNFGLEFFSAGHSKMKSKTVIENNQKTIKKQSKMDRPAGRNTLRRLW